jgi:hypothetical protein
VGLERKQRAMQALVVFLQNFARRLRDGYRPRRELPAFGPVQVNQRQTYRVIQAWHQGSIAQLKADAHSSVQPAKARGNKPDAKANFNQVSRR